MAEIGASGGPAETIVFRPRLEGEEAGLLVERSDGIACAIPVAGPSPVPRFDPRRRALYEQAYNLFLAHGAPIAWEETEVAGRVDLADGSRLLPSGSGWLVAISGGKGGEEGRVLRCCHPYEAGGLRPRRSERPAG